MQRLRSQHRRIDEREGAGAARVALVALEALVALGPGRSLHALGTLRSGGACGAGG